MTVQRSGYDDPSLMAWWDRAYTGDNLIRNTFFQSPAWNRAWCDHYVADDPRREDVLLRVERDGAIVAAVPLFLQRRETGPFTLWRYLLWNGDRLAQYPDMVTTERDVEATWNAVHGWLSREYRGAWLLLRDVLPEATAASVPREDARRVGIGSFLRIDLADLDEERYPLRCTPHMQREIRRSRGRLGSDGERQGLRWIARRAPSSAEVDVLVAMNRARFGAASWFTDRRNVDFFRDLVVRSGNEILFTSLEKEGTPVHVMVSYLHGDTVHYVLSGLDARAKALSPGTMNLDRTICWTIGEGYRYFDFLRGDEPYKREFAPECRFGCDVEWPLPGSRARRAVAGAMQRLRAVAGQT